MAADIDRNAWVLPSGDIIQVETHVDGTVWRPTYYARHFGELLVQQPLKGQSVLDVGCGSGVLAVLAAKCGAVVTATDLSASAVEASRQNAARNEVEIECLESDGLQSVLALGKRFDLIVCNSPSIPGRTTLDRSSREEWAENGPDGRSLLDNVLTYGPRCLKRNGRLLTCSNAEQGWSKTERLLKSRWRSYKVLKSNVFEMDLTIYSGFIEKWIREGAVWIEDERYYHNVKFLMAYC